MRFDKDWHWIRLKLMSCWVLCSPRISSPRWGTLVLKFAFVWSKGPVHCWDGLKRQGGEVHFAKTVSSGFLKAFTFCVSCDPTKIEIGIFLKNCNTGQQFAVFFRRLKSLFSVFVGISQRFLNDPQLKVLVSRRKMLISLEVGSVWCALTDLPHWNESWKRPPTNVSRPKEMVLLILENILARVCDFFMKDLKSFPAVCFWILTCLSQSRFGFLDLVFARDPTRAPGALEGHGKLATFSLPFWSIHRVKAANR